MWTNSVKYTSSTSAIIGYIFEVYLFSIDSPCIGESLATHSIWIVALGCIEYQDVRSLCIRRFR
jgi:hypothetical protein